MINKELRNNSLKNSVKCPGTKWEKVEINVALSGKKWETSPFLPIIRERVVKTLFS